MGVKFLGRQLTIAVMVELLERLGGVCEFFGGKGSVLVGVKCRNHRGWRWWKVARRRSFRSLSLGIGPRRAHFVSRDLAVAVLVEFAEGGRGVSDFLGGELSVVIGIEECEQWRDGRRRAVAAFAVRTASISGMETDFMALMIGVSRIRKGIGKARPGVVAPGRDDSHLRRVP